MTDNELLEMAAKASDIELDWGVPFGASPWRMTGTKGTDDYGPADIWNPLTDDGDAFRLAVKLDVFCNTGLTNQFMNDAGDCEKTRRLIVEYAAMVGKAA